jgi:hypothetical protein
LEVDQQRVLRGCSGSSPLQRFPRDARSVTALGIARSSCECSSVYALDKRSILPGSCSVKMQICQPSRCSDLRTLGLIIKALQIARSCQVIELRKCQGRLPNRGFRTPHTYLRPMTSHHNACLPSIPRATHLRLSSYLWPRRRLPRYNSALSMGWKVDR